MAERRLNLLLDFFQDGTQAIQSTLAGGVQMVVAAGPEIISARVAGSDMTMIAGYMNTLPYSIVAGKNIVKYEQLKVTKLRSADSVQLQTWLCDLRCGFIDQLYKK